MIIRNNKQSEKFKRFVSDFKDNQLEMSNLLTLTKAFAKILDICRQDFSKKIKNDELSKAWLKKRNARNMVKGGEITIRKLELIEACSFHLRKGDSERVDKAYKVFTETVSSFFDYLMFDRDDTEIAMIVTTDDGKENVIKNEQCMIEFCNLHNSEVELIKHIVAAICLLRGHIESRVKSK